MTVPIKGPFSPVPQLTLEARHRQQTIPISKPQPKDARFCRDLSWIPDIIKKAYASGKSHISPNLTLEARHRQQTSERSYRERLASVVTNGYEVYTHLDRSDLILIVEILRHDCDRLRRELDDLRGVIR